MSGKKTKKLSRMISNNIHQHQDWRPYLEKKLENLNPKSGYYKLIKGYIVSKTLKEDELSYYRKNCTVQETEALIQRINLK